MTFRAFIFMLAWCGTLPGDLTQVKSEPNLEKRARAALDNAEEVLRQARESYSAGAIDRSAALLAEVQESVELAGNSLKETGKNPVKHPKHFKAAEQKTRELLRKLDNFDKEMNVADRPTLESVKAKVQQVHDDLLESIMGKKK